jgi:hypothetical protein
VAHVRGAGRLVRQASDGDQAAAAGDVFEEENGRCHLIARRPPIGIRTIRLVWMGRNDVPEQDLVLDAELPKDTVDDRRRRVGRAGPGQLPLRGERDPAQPGAAVAGRLADEQDGRVTPRLEVGL